MDRYVLSDAQWARMEPHCLGKKSDPGRSGEDNRRFVEAVLWIARTGAPWRDLPDEFGRWYSVYTRFWRWARKGSGNGCSRLYRMIRISNTSSSMRRTSGSTNMEPAQGGDSESGD